MPERESHGIAFWSTKSSPYHAYSDIVKIEKAAPLPNPLSEGCDAGVLSRYLTLQSFRSGMCADSGSGLLRDQSRPEL